MSCNTTWHNTNVFEIHWDKESAWLGLSYSVHKGSSFVWWAKDLSKGVLESCFIESLAKELEIFLRRQTTIGVHLVRQRKDKSKSTDNSIVVILKYYKGNNSRIAVPSGYKDTTVDALWFIDDYGSWKE